jgi:TolA-binding protein
MKKYLLPTLVSFALSSSVLAQAPAAPDLPKAPPAPQSYDAEMMNHHQKMMDKQMAQMKEQMAQMEEIREQIKQITQTRDPQKRQELMENMRKNQQAMREKIWKERGAMMPNRPAPFSRPYFNRPPRFNQPRFNAPRFGGPGFGAPAWHGPQMPQQRYAPMPNEGMMPGYDQAPGHFFGMPAPSQMPTHRPADFPPKKLSKRHLGFHDRVEQRLEKIEKELQTLTEALKDK